MPSRRSSLHAGAGREDKSASARSFRSQSVTANGVISARGSYASYAERLSLAGGAEAGT